MIRNFLFMSVLALFLQTSSVVAGTEGSEDLSKSKNRYEYVYPYLNISKSINNLKLSSAGYNKKYDTNKDVASLTNNLNYDSYDKYFKTGLKSNWNFILKNTNISSDTDEVKSTNNLLSAFHYNFNLPLINKGELLDSIVRQFGFKLRTYNNSYEVYLFDNSITLYNIDLH